MARPRTGRVAAFALIPLITALTPFLVFPLLARVAGVDAWVAVAVGQSVGAFVALVVSAGLNVVGPTLVGQADESGRGVLLREGTRARLLLLPVGLAVAVALAWSFAPSGERTLAWLMAVAVALNGMSASWYLIGIGRPGLFVAIELAPKAAATACGGALLLTTGSALWYPLLLILVSVVSLAGYSARKVGIARLLDPRPGDALAFLRQRWEPAVTEMVGGAYTTLTVSFVGASASAPQAASYVSGDKLYKLGQSVIGTLGNALQVRVAAAGEARPRRMREALLVHGAVGVAGLVAFATLGPLLTALLFGEDVALDEPTAVAFGVAALALSLNTSVGRHILLVMQRTRLVLASVIVGAVVGIPSILALSHAFGAVGGASGLAVSEVAVLVVQLVGWAIVRRTR